MSFDLKTYLSAHQSLVEGYLERLLEREKNAPAPLLEAMRYSLLAPGKRLRPILVFMAAGSAGGESTQALPAAAAVELIHTYSLIHDDLPAMDDDDLRRGLPTCHKQFGEALAILAGDALLTLAFRVLAEGFMPRTGAACCLELAQGSGACGMVGGQVEDLAWESDLGVRQDPLFPRSDRPHTAQALQHIHSRKTGALFRSCLRLGIWSVQGERPQGIDESLLARLDRFGECFGLVFQITDDLLDVEGAEESTGKRVGKDAARGKLTYPGLLGVQESRRQAGALAEEAFDLLATLGTMGEPLAALTRFVLERDR